MSEFLNTLIETTTTNGNPLITIAVALLIITVGHIVVKLVETLLRRTWLKGTEKFTKKQVEKRETKIKYTTYTLDGVVIALAIGYLNSDIAMDLYEDSIDLLPEIFSAVLLITLGIIAINILTKLGEGLLQKVGVRNYLRELGLSTKIFGLISVGVKAFLYLIFIQIILSQLGLGDTFINELVTASSWAAALLIAALLFWSFKDIFKDYGAGIYLNNSTTVRPGEEVDLDGERGEIRDVQPLNTIIDTQDGYRLLAPNSEIIKSKIKFKRTQNDLDTLEEIKNYFVPQEGGSGPATVEIALDILGYRHSQVEIAEEMESETPEELAKVVEDLTNQKVKAKMIEAEKITNLGDEFKTWFNDGALTIPHINKEEVFLDQEEYGYVLAVGVEGNEVLVIDPDKESGGVYYINQERLENAVSETPAGERGYITLAPEGTTAHWRIKNNLIYSDKTYYDELSKTLENRLTKISRRGKILNNVMPESVERYTERWRTEENVSRIWTPQTTDKSSGEEKDEDSNDN